MRLGLLSLISWLVTLTTPLFSLWTFSFSGRDLILLFGGLFLLFKATSELHERLEGITHAQTGPKVYAGFGLVVAQIVVLDAVFSLDAVITAVGMVDNLYVMMAAVVISIVVMMLASKVLTRFVNAHPTVVVLCLSFLLMIGLSLVAEGLGFHIPKGYLYAAIGFSIVIEFFNQLARRNFLKLQSNAPLRDRTAQAVLSLLGGRKGREAVEEHEVKAMPDVSAFGVEERNMVSGVLTLAERSIRSVMTPRGDVSWVNLNDSSEKMLQLLRETPHSMIPVCNDDLDNVVGIARSKDLIEDLVSHGKIDPASMREAVVVPEAAGVLKAMETLKRSRGQLVLVVDEFGTVQGVLTPIDILEAIAGEFPDEDELPDVEVLGPGHWRIEAPPTCITWSKCSRRNPWSAKTATTTRWPASCWRILKTCRPWAKCWNSMICVMKSSKRTSAASPAWTCAASSPITVCNTMASVPRLPCRMLGSAFLETPT